MSGENTPIELEQYDEGPVIHVGDTTLRLRVSMEMETDEVHTLEGDDLTVKMENTTDGTYYVVESPVESLPDAIIEPWVVKDD